MIQEIISLTKLHPSKLRNIYVYGSRVYGTNTINSDTDLIVVACTPRINEEINNGILNIHITTPDAFKDQLNNHDIHCLECIYAPENAKIMLKIDYLKDFKIDTLLLKKMLLSQSTWAWDKAKKRIGQGNIVGGAKSLFHSLRILKFGLQILKYGKITNFSEANCIWNEIRDFEGLEWDDYQERWIKDKKQLIHQLKGKNV